MECNFAYFVFVLNNIYICFRAVSVPEPLRESLQVLREFNTPSAEGLEELQKALVPQFENVLQKYIEGSVINKVLTT